MRRGGDFNIAARHPASSAFEKAFGRKAYIADQRGPLPKAIDSFHQSPLLDEMIARWLKGRGHQHALENNRR
jgi:hypothetical protein